MFSLGKHLGQQITHLTSIATYSLNYTKCAVRVQVLCCAFTEKRALDLQTIIRYKLKMIQKLLKTLNIFFFSKRRTRSVVRRKNSYILDTFFHSTSTGQDLWGEGAGGEAHLMASNEYDHQ